MSTLRQRLRAAFPGGEKAVDEVLSGPIHGDLLGAEHLAERARAVARDQVVKPPRPLEPRARLLARLDSTRKVLAAASRRLAAEAAAGADPDPSGEWLLDNYHVIQEHGQEAREALPRRYYRELPELATGPLRGYPRAYELAIALISHSEGRVDMDNVDLFVEAFQEVEPLVIGELWAIPAMLRLGLLENIRRMTLRTMQRLDAVAEADRWATRIQVAGEAGGSALSGALVDLTADAARLTPIFLTRLLGQLRQATGASPALVWLERWMEEEGLPPEDAASRATQRVAHTQLMMANSITSLRSIGRRDWRRFVERQSAMEAVLCGDPSGFYPRMTFGTRDRYRHVVERLAKRSGKAEVEVARLAVMLAAAPDAAEPAADRRRHVGYYLIDDGLDMLERAIDSVPAPPERFLRWLREHPDTVLVGGLATFTLLALLAVGVLAGIDVAMVAWPAILIFTFLPALDIGISTINQVVTAVLPPRVLPALAFKSDGVPPEYTTAVVVPILLVSESQVEEAVRDLEVLYLANREPHLHFAILSDFTDAAAETMPEDDRLLAVGVSGIEDLNRQYGGDGGGRFHLLHRPRHWNPAEGCWMGWERKRGKLAEFNRLVRGAGRESFSRIVGDAEALGAVTFVITLDADTMLPQGAAAELIGTMAHPLNRAVFDPARGRIVAGYGILQPRVGVSLTSAHRSRFAAIHSGVPGVDPYTTAVSDVYQDLYGEGSFTGKGIYDVDAFTEATRGRFPENTLLSHDLIEGNYSRAGLATGIIVYDDYPATYVAHARRKHRWIRGDWQLLPWLGPRVPGPEGTEPNRLPLLSRWKILDNLRRSTVEIAQFALIVAGWTVLAGSPIRWTLLGLGAIAAPWLVSLLLAAVRPPTDRSWRAYYRAVAGDARSSLQQFALAVAFLPHQAWLSADAIVRTLWRMLVTRRHLLEWETAAAVERAAAGSPAAARRAMAPSLIMVALLAAAVTVLVVLDAGQAGTGSTSLLLFLVAIWPLTILWLLSPLLAGWLSRAPQEEQLDPADRSRVMEYAERHWRYFDRHVNEGTHWLAPDNVQADPVEVVAMRTSPTNIGLQLLATVSAHDLGLIDRADMTARLERTMATVTRLPKFRGHCYNWYDLADLRVLEPAYVSTVDSGNLAGHLLALREACLELAGAPRLAGHATVTPEPRLMRLAATAQSLVAAMDFSFLLDKSSKLFTIGFHPDTHTRDTAAYDLLASEARLAVFVAIAKGEAPVEAWFRLGRALVRHDGVPMMVSWSGSMFEYLMPLLVMKTFPGTLLDQSDRGAIRRQIAYGKSRGVPWGVSESAYNFRDHALTYQYRAFGVPDLALKRGLGRDLVVAPYATALAAMLAPEAAMDNLVALVREDALGPYGFWDALDYTRPTPGTRRAIVKTVMAHHAGMTLVAFTNLLRDNPWPRRFHRDPSIRAVELLLQERVPRRVLVQEDPVARIDRGRDQVVTESHVVRLVDSAETAQPRIALLGDLPYTVMVTHAGGGFSRHDELDVTRWRADGTTDDTGQFCYIHDLAAGRTWSAGHQPTGAVAEEYHAHLAPDRVTIHRVDGPIETRTEIVVVQADAAEVRRVTLTNHGPDPRELELTSYAEVVLGPGATAAAHPAFANLFVETEWHEWCSAITARRRPRSRTEPAPWCVHVVDSGPHVVGPVTCETSRERFLGRGRTTRDPVAMDHPGPLSSTTGAVLDPILSLRARVRVPSGGVVTVTFTTLVADSREHLFELADRYHDPHAGQRALDLAWTSTQIDLAAWGISSQQAAVFQEAAGHLLYAREALRPPDDERRRNRGDQHRLWAHGISGDLPILLAVIDDMKGLATLRELFNAHRYWRRHGLRVDLVVVISHPHDYLQSLRQAIEVEMLATSGAGSIDQPGGVYLRRRDTFDAADYLTLSATARMHVPCDGRSLERIVPPTATRTEWQLDTLEPHYIERRARPRPRVAAPRGPARPMPAPDGAGNGYGALTEDGNYRIEVAGDRVPPAPWSNVIANPHGGFLVTERSAGCTWAGNAYFYRLTPWHNDPVTDPPCDVLYLAERDSDTIWSATPAPVRNGGAYVVEHAPGRSTFRHEHDGIATVLTVGLPHDAAVKLSHLELTNRSARRRTVTLTAYAEWTLGVRREETWLHVSTEFNAAARAVLARNRFDPAFRDRVAFLAVTEPVLSHTGDRREFLGRHGVLADPAGLRRDRLGGHTGAGLDPCAALRIEVTLDPGERREVGVVLGAGETASAARDQLERFATAAALRQAIDDNCARWETRLGTITVRTPEPTLDAILNRWALYQALSSRMWGRMGFYQSSGAYGFRDQLQDCMAFVHAEPAVAREHLLRAASRQFVEGDVQHWWHPHTGRGVRTRFSDDLAWLPFVVDHYVQSTGDTAVLDEAVPFLRMRELAEDEHEIYDLPEVTTERASLHEHCLRALSRACTAGRHGLPLIGTGDWNDGFSRVGIGGEGESVWLGWFLIATCERYAVHAERRGDAAAADRLRRQAAAYRQAVEAHAWDGAWYRRAWFDDGTPLGTAEGEACRIDSIAQSWGVISGAASPERQDLAMASVERHLVREDLRLITLLTPPFDAGSLDPGYIKGYLPGVRENGAQYTHAALWVVQAVAMRGDGNRAMELFQLLNPLTHARTPADVETYRVEPYVVAADVYTAENQAGRGGWTWYTGSASWMYRVGIESLVGVTRHGDRLAISPRVPDQWGEMSIEYRHGGAVYAIRVTAPARVGREGAVVTVDGVPSPDGAIELRDDGMRHEVLVAPRGG